MEEIDATGERGKMEGVNTWVREVRLQELTLKERSSCRRVEVER